MAHAELIVGDGALRDRRLLVPRPALFGVLEAAERVIVVTGAAGTGKTFLMRSWIAQADLVERVAWVPVGRDERDPQAFWTALLAALRETDVGSRLVRELTPAPNLDGAAIVRRLLEDLRALDVPLWLVIDDLHELQANDALDQLQLLLAEAPSPLRVVLLTRRDLRLGLHRLRVEGELTEIRSDGLRFTADEARALLDAAGVGLSDAALRSLLEITEGWAAGLRLATLSLAHHADPDQLAASFSGRDRGVVEYLLLEVLERLPQAVGRMLLRTSILERVSGPLADALTGATGSERMLAELEEAGAFVVAVDRRQTWFRYHHLFADLLALELQRTAPDELSTLHIAAAQWLSDHGDPIQAIHHAQAAADWELAARLLADAWFGLYLDGRTATAHGLLTRFPAARLAADPELAVLAADAARSRGALREAERYVARSAREAPAVPAERRGRFEIALSIVRLSLARAHNDVVAAAEEAQRLLAPAQAPQALIDLGLGEDLQTVALTDLGVAEIWAGRIDDAERHLERALVEARRIGRPLLELQALAHWALVASFRSLSTAQERAQQAIELAETHGWEETTPVAVAAIVRGAEMLWRGRLEEADEWLGRAERVLLPEAQPAAAMMLYAAKGLLNSSCGRHDEATAAYRVADRMQRLLVMPHMLARLSHAHRVKMLISLGEIDRARQALDELEGEVRQSPEMRAVFAALRLTEDDPEGALVALAPVVESLERAVEPRFEIQRLLLEATARDALGDAGAAFHALERALDVAEPKGLLLPFLLVPTPELLQRHTRLRTSHASLVSEILALLSGTAPPPRSDGDEPIDDPLSDSELRVLRFLPTNLQASEIAAELYVSVNTIRTHMRHLYAKLGVHGRAEAVERARRLGLLAPSTRRR